MRRDCRLLFCRDRCFGGFWLDLLFPFVLLVKVTVFCIMAERMNGRELLWTG
jgi:hypothetical protein